MIKQKYYNFVFELICYLITYMKLINERNRLNRSTEYVVKSDLKQYDKWINTYYTKINNTYTDKYTVLTSYQQYLETLHTPKSSISRKLSNIKNYHDDFVDFVKRKKTTPITNKKEGLLNADNLKLVKSSSFVTPVIINTIPETNRNISEKNNTPSTPSQNNIKKYFLYSLSFTLFLTILFSYYFLPGKDGTTKVSNKLLLELANSDSSLLNNQKVILSLSVKNQSKKDELSKVIHLSVFDGRTSKSPISKAICTFNVANSKDEDILIVDLNKYCSKKFLSNFSANNYLGIRVNNDPESYPRISIGDLLNPSFYSYFDESATNDDTQTEIVKSLRSKLLSSFNEKVKITPMFDQLSPTTTASQAATISATLSILTLTPSPTP